MRRIFLLFPLIIAASPANAVDAEIHKNCLQAADYKGCVEVMSGGINPNISPIQNLIKDLKVLSSRLESVSLNSLSERATAFRDTLSLIEPSNLKTDYEKSIYEGAETIDNMISALASSWQERIYDGTEFTGGSKYYNCSTLKYGVHRFNIATPDEYSIYYNGIVEKTWLGNIEKCSPQEWQMIDSIQRYIAELTMDPAVKARKIATEERRRELCRLEPWERYLEENQDMRNWVLANPDLAEQRKKKFFEKPGNKTNCDGSKPGHDLIEGNDNDFIDMWNF